jgi:hypothetical protein
MSRVTSNFAHVDGLWSYTVCIDGAETASGSGYTSQVTMQAAREQAEFAANRTIESEAAAERYKAQRRRAVVMLAPASIAPHCAPLVRALLKLPLHIEVATVAPFESLPTGILIVGLCSVGLDFRDADLHWWVHDRVLHAVVRDGIYASIESDISDLVPRGAKVTPLFQDL